MRIALAAVLFTEPDLLLLDESTNYLDIDSRKELIHALNNFNGAIILISHDRHLIEVSMEQF
ncbi:hypothetical protein [Bartonella sp. AR 15-3]|uniref:hypothetical protein n=1 Tax=Bartonella sp. AR 15-3 TaxID=545617 RepID=UPI0001F4CD7F|nr:hypothetical protein [Bartonella sp. AR 15-3]OPB31839.1 ATP-binding cassette, subfamily F, member 3 [Bartonella sp. AR 15-3]CBI79124.1 conserved hypothetical protein [Bartonella sp. AR 15-3]